MYRLAKEGSGILLYYNDELIQKFDKYKYLYTNEREALALIKKREFKKYESHLSKILYRDYDGKLKELNENEFY